MNHEDATPLFPRHDECRSDPSAYPRPSLKQVGTFDRDRLEEKLLSDYDGYEEPRRFSFSLPPRAVLVGAGIGAALLFLICAARLVASNMGNGAPHLVTADASPVRAKPDDPGGVFVDHEDKSVYEAMRGESPSALPKVLHILPETEKPANIYDMRAAQDAEEKIEENPEESSPVSLAAAEAVQSVAQDVPKNAAPPEDVDAMLTDYIYGKNKPTNVANENEEEATDPAQKPTPLLVGKPSVALRQPPAPSPSYAVSPAKTSVANAATQTSDGHVMKNPIPGNFVQVGAFTATDDAKRHINKVLSAFPTLVEGKTDYYYQPVSMADKKTLYRLKIGPFAEEKAAREACAKMAQKNMDCMYVRH